MTSLSFEDALLYAVQGRAILFIGAGFSTLFKDIESCPVPIGSGLATVMVDKCNGKPTKDREMHGIAKMGHILFLPAHRLGRLWKFKKDDVDEWVKAGGAAERTRKE